MTYSLSLCFLAGNERRVCVCVLCQFVLSRICWCGMTATRARASEWEASSERAGACSGASAAAAAETLCVSGTSDSQTSVWLYRLRKVLDHFCMNVGSWSSCDVMWCDCFEEGRNTFTVWCSDILHRSYQLNISFKMHVCCFILFREMYDTGPARRNALFVWERSERPGLLELAESMVKENKHSLQPWWAEKHQTWWTLRKKQQSDTRVRQETTYCIESGVNNSQRSRDHGFYVSRSSVETCQKTLAHV